MKLWRKRSQEEIFSSFGWWDKGCFLGQMTGDRCDYIQTCAERAMGTGALRDLRVLEVGCGGGLICEDLAQRGALMVGVDPSESALVSTAWPSVLPIIMVLLNHCRIPRTAFLWSFAWMSWNT